MVKKRKNLVILYLFIGVLYGLFLVNNCFSLDVDNYKASTNYDITHNCSNMVCVAGEAAEWYVTISNKGLNAIEYSAIDLVDTLNETNIFASIDWTYRPTSSRKGEFLSIYPGQKVVVRLNGTIPNPNSGDSLLYYPCFTRIVPKEDWPQIAKSIYELKHCYSLNETMPVFQCISNDHCSHSEYCKTDKCYRLNCSNCQYIFNHTCVDYECCDSYDCEPNEFCANNTCLKLECESFEAVIDYKCTLLNCSDNEDIIDNQCKKLNCSFDEYAFNHSCSKLNCLSYEYIEDHTCITLSCREDQAAFNHTCNQLYCPYNETISNHSCVELHCYFFQKIANHRCINNIPMLLKFIGEILALIFIAGFLILDIKKYGMQKVQKAGLKKNSMEPAETKNSSKQLNKRL